MKVPLAAGVPESRPLTGFKAMPAGREPALINHWYGFAPPTAVRLCE
jgi:hypothetical protein